MVLFDRTKSGKRIDSRWHSFREQARRTAVSPEEFAPSDRVHYDLDTAGITGKDNPRTYTHNRPTNLVYTNEIDVRELRDR
jgi:hypothetical protein